MLTFNINEGKISDLNVIELGMRGIVKNVDDYLFKLNKYKD